jgi:hypothetical protein
MIPYHGRKEKAFLGGTAEETSGENVIRRLAAVK